MPATVVARWRACQQVSRAAPARGYTATPGSGCREQRFETLSGGQQARFQILLLELSGATLLLLDEPTDNLGLASAEALEDALAAYQGTVIIAATHDRWFMRSLDSFLVFHADQRLTEALQPI